MKNATPPASRTILTATRLLAILGIGVGVLAGATPTEAQNNPAPTRFRVEAIRHVSGGDAEVDLTWLYPTGPGATGFTVRYDLFRTRQTCQTATPTGSEFNSLKQQGAVTGGSPSPLLIGRISPASGYERTSLERCLPPGSSLNLPRSTCATRRRSAPSRHRRGPMSEQETPGSPLLSHYQALPGFCTVDIGGVDVVTNHAGTTPSGLKGNHSGTIPEDTVEVHIPLRWTNGQFLSRRPEHRKREVVRLQDPVKVHKAKPGPNSPWSEESEVVTPRGTAQRDSPSQTGLSA